MKKHVILFLPVLMVLACRNRESNNKKYRDIPESTIINLYDAFGEQNKDLQKDFGFSCIIKYQEKTILFDSGTNADIFKNNVKALNIDLMEIDFVVASHAHFDHINGLDYLLEVNPDVKIYFPHDLFWGANNTFNLAGQDASIVDSLDIRMRYFDGDFQSYSFNQSGRFWNANIEFIKESQEIVPGIKLISTSSPYMGYFSKYPSLDEQDQVGKAAQLNLTELKELSLSLETEKGEVIIVGCSHSTVEQIVKESIAYTQNDIALVYGGYHLLPYKKPELTDLAIRLKDELKVKRVAPAHCTGHLAFKIFQDRFKENYVFAGLGSSVDF